MKNKNNEFSILPKGVAGVSCVTVEEMRQKMPPNFKFFRTEKKKDEENESGPQKKS